MTALKPRGADGGPKRTPPHLGDAWQKQASYDVEEEGIDAAVVVLLLLISTYFRYNSLFLKFCPQIKADKLKKKPGRYTT